MAGGRIQLLAFALVGAIALGGVLLLGLGGAGTWRALRAVPTER